MKSIKLAFTLFGLGYLIATIVGFSTYYIHITLMWPEMNADNTSGVDETCLMVSERDAR